MTFALMTFELSVKIFSFLWLTEMHHLL